MTSASVNCLSGAQDALGDPGAAASLDAAVAGLRKSGMNQYLRLALLARAAHRRRRAAAGETDLIEGIRAALAEVEDIAGEEMRLYLTDLALERARLGLDVPAIFDSEEAARAEAEARIAAAAELIAQTGYRRRVTVVPCALRHEMLLRRHGTLPKAQGDRG